MTYHAIVRNGTLVTDEPLELPEGTRVSIDLHSTVASDSDKEIPSLYDRLKSVIGTAEGLPPDFAENHDHYIHGTAKGIDKK